MRGVTSFLQFSNGNAHLFSSVSPRKRLLLESATWYLLLLSAFGLAFNNVLIYKLGDFAVTLGHLLLILTIISVIPQKRQHKFGLIFPVITMWFLEIYHAIVSGYAGEPEWLKSFAQMLAYSTGFIFLVGFRSNGATLRKITPWVMKLGIVLGSINILQFVLLVSGVSAYIPQGWSVKSLDYTELIWRYGGFTPAIGLAIEPSYSALGLVTILTCLLFFYDNYLLEDRRLFWISLLILCGGIVITFSLTGIAMACIIFLIWLWEQRKVQLILLMLLMIVMIGNVSARIGVIDPIQTRFRNAFRGADNSAQIRIVAAVRLLFARPTSFENFAYGTGLGMEDREVGTYLNIYREVSLRSLAQDEVKIHNILTAIRFFQGWLGLTLYGFLLWGVLLPRAGKLTTFFPTLVFFILYHFALGLYLNPNLWSLLALMALLRRIQLGSTAPCTLKHQTCRCEH